LHLIVLLDPADIVVNLHHAYGRPEFSNGHYVCFHSGPSATTDIEGVLIHGAQGVRSLSVLPISRSPRPSKPQANSVDELRGQEPVGDGPVTLNKSSPPGETCAIAEELKRASNRTSSNRPPPRHDRAHARMIGHGEPQG
jgi:hypothetical protein